jgi:hypothetical protein
LDEVKFTTAPPIPLGQALETCGAVCTSVGSINTTPWDGKTNVTHDGIVAAESGRTLDSETSSMSTTVGGVTNVSFRWKVSSESNCTTIPKSLRKPRKFLPRKGAKAAK